MLVRPLHHVMASALALANLAPSWARMPEAPVAVPYPKAKVAALRQLDVVTDPLPRARAIARTLAQRNPEWSWRWRHVDRFVERLSGKPGFEKTLMLLGSDNPQVRNGAFRALLYASEAEQAGLPVRAINQSIDVPGKGRTDIDILLQDGTILEVKNAKTLKNSPQLEAQLRKLAAASEARQEVAGISLSGDRYLLARGRVTPSGQQTAADHGFTVAENLRSRDMAPAIGQTEVAALRRSAQELSSTMKGLRVAGGAWLMIAVLEGGHTAVLQLTGRITAIEAKERYAENTAKATAVGTAVYGAILLGANPAGIIVLATGTVVYLVTDLAIDTLRPYYHVELLTADDIQAALPHSWRYTGGVSAQTVVRSALPKGWRYTGDAGP